MFDCYLAKTATIVDTRLRAESMLLLSQHDTYQRSTSRSPVVVIYCTACYTSFAQHICSTGCTSLSDAQHSSVARCSLWRPIELTPSPQRVCRSGGLLTRTIRPRYQPSRRMHLVTTAYTVYYYFRAVSSVQTAAGQHASAVRDPIVPG
jgi:hypothetical protein